MNKFTSLLNLVQGLADDAQKFYEKGNSAAGTRVRKGMQDLKKLAQDIRSEVQEKKNKAAAAKAKKAAPKKPAAKKK